MAYTITCRKRTRRVEWTREPTLSELIEDPIAQALMVADGVEQYDLDVLVAHLLRQRGPSFAIVQAPG